MSYRLTFIAPALVLSTLTGVAYLKGAEGEPGESFEEAIAGPEAERSGLRQSPLAGVVLGQDGGLVMQRR